MRLVPVIFLAGVLSGHSQILFQDTFDRADSRNIAASLDGVTDGTGSALAVDDFYLQPWLDPANAAPGYGAQDGVATNGGGAQILDNELRLAVGSGTSNAYINHNFTNPAILAAGGFSVSVDVAGFNQTGYQQGGGFAVGMSRTEADSAADAFNLTPGRMTGAFHDNSTIASAVPGVVVSDFWVALRGNNSLVWGGSSGTITGITGLAAKTGTISVNFTFADFAAGSTVNYEVFLDSVSRGTGSFAWSGTAENHIGLDGRDSGFVAFDNFTVRTLPPQGALEVTPNTVAPDNPARNVTLSWSAAGLPAGATYEITADRAVGFPNGDATGSAAAGSGTVAAVVDGTLGDTTFTIDFQDGATVVASAGATVRQQRPNVVLILLDDMGFSDFGCYGSEINTPTIDSLAANGLRYRNFYNTARCSTTRCALLSGLYTQQSAVNPGASLPDLRTDNNVTIAELLSTTGYRRYMAGKWHLGTNDRSPISRGFQHIFGQVGGGTFPHNQVTGGNQDSFWNLANFGYYSENDEIPEIDWTGTQFHQTDGIGEYSMDFIDHHVGKQDSAPFFLYMPFNAVHWDINAPATMADRYTDVADLSPDGLTTDGGTDGKDYYQYEVGWDQVRADRFARQLALGVRDASWVLPPKSPAFNSNGAVFHDAADTVEIPDWNTLSASRQADLARRMALYAAMLEQVDLNIKKVVDHLEAMDQLDNTLIFILADNGGNYEGGLFGKTNGTINAAPVTGTTNLRNMGQPSNPDLHIGGGWANVNNTPFRLYKHYQHEGGIRTPCIVHWPDGITAPGRWIDDRGHLIDIMATISDVTGTPLPASWPGRALLPLEGESLAPHFDPATVADFPARPLGFEHEWNRAWFKGNHKFVTKNFSLPDGSSAQDEFELYDLSADPTELNNLAATEPALLAEMIDEWNAWAQHVGVPSQRLIVPPAPQVSPAPLPADLFVDTFNRANNPDHDASTTGMSGPLLASLGIDATYWDSWEQGSTEISGSGLRMAAGAGMSETAIRHNFTDAAILAAGGFSVQMRIDAIVTDTTDLANRFAGIAVGLSAAEAQASDDINGSQNPAGSSFRGQANGATPGTADFFVELDHAGNLKTFSNGSPVGSTPVGRNTGTLVVSYQVSSFDAGSTVIVSAFLDGEPVDLDTGSAATTRSFQWDASDTNHVGLSARATGYVSLDNLAIRTLPLSGTLSVEHALRAGLDGALTDPSANPDGDRLDNFGEWAFGTDPSRPDDEVAATGLMSIEPDSGVFRFTHRRLTGHAAAGLAYIHRISDDLDDWREVAAIEESVVPLPASPGYEVVTLTLPADEVGDEDRLFLQILAEP